MTKYYSKHGRKYNKRPRISALIADINEINRKKMEKPRLTEESQHRYEVHRRIMDLLEEGKSKDELLSILYEEYSDSPVKKYFEQYVDFRISKANLSQNNKEIKSDEGR